jgi:simple sugar transport system permease protein
MPRLCRVFLALLIPAASLATALAAVAGLVLITGESPGWALVSLVRGALGNPEGIGYTLFYATDYVFAGLAVALPFRADLFDMVAKAKPHSAASRATLRPASCSPLLTRCRFPCKDSCSPALVRCRSS